MVWGSRGSLPRKTPQDPAWFQQYFNLKKKKKEMATLNSFFLTLPYSLWDLSSLTVETEPGPMAMKVPSPNHWLLLLLLSRFSCV